MFIIYLFSDCVFFHPVTFNPNTAAGSVYICGSQGSRCECWQQALTSLLFEFVCLLSEEEFYLLVSLKVKNLTVLDECVSSDNKRTTKGQQAVILWFETRVSQ